MSKLQSETLETTNLRLVCNVKENVTHFEVHSLDDESLGTMSLYSDGSVVPALSCNYSLLCEAYAKISEYASELGVSTTLQFL